MHNRRSGRSGRAARSSDPLERHAIGQNRLLLTGAGVVVLCWAMLVAAVSTRVHLVLGYTTIPMGEAALEMLLAGNAVLALAACISMFWLGLLIREIRGNTGSKISPGYARKAIVALACAVLPLILSVHRCFSEQAIAARYWEPLWIAAWTGISFAFLGCSALQSRSVTSRRCFLAVVVGSGSLAYWWYRETVWYYEHFQLGFNDFGHFAQRIANTAAGRGFLMESPVLPTFWDHFNPGLVLLVPLWKLLPTVHLLFWIQAGCLAGSSLLVWRIARQLGYPPIAACCWASAWLVQPAVGQFNLAYTYGWHPITLAIPMLLGVFSLLLQRRWAWAVCVCLLAMSIEEGVIAVGSSVSLACAFSGIFLSDRKGRDTSAELVLGLSSRAWLSVGILTAVLFGVVYRFSGLGDFQVGRFVALGSSTWEILLSPILRPRAFWGELLQPTKLAFVLSLLLPCFLPSLLLGWRMFLGTLPPLLLLLVWDHKPAACLGFHYSSAILPCLWFAALWGARKIPGDGAAFGSLVTGLILSIYVGQLPYSSPSIVGVVGKSYGLERLASRGPGTVHGKWLTTQIARIRDDGSEVLASGRIASHLVGNRDVETVGQFLQRYEQLNALEDRQGNPIRHYKWIVMDREEMLQQSDDQMLSVEIDAERNGFVVVAEFESLILLERRDPG